MGRRCFYPLLFVCVLFWIAGCADGEEPPTLTPLPAVEQTVTVASTLIPSTNTSQPITTVTSTAVTLTQTLLVTQTYQLRPPDSQILYDLRLNPYTMPQSFADAIELQTITLPQLQLDTPYWWVENFYEQNFDYFIDVIESDFEGYYPDGLPNLQEYLFEQTHDQIPISSYLFGLAVVDYINSRPGLDVTDLEQFEIPLNSVNGDSQEQGNIKITVYHAELDGEPEDEFLLQIHLEEAIELFLPVEANDTNHITIMDHEIPAQRWPFTNCYKPDLSHDFTGDGVKDLLIQCTFWPGPDSSDTTTVIYSWINQTFIEVGKTLTEHEVSRITSEIDIIDNHAGGSDLRITQFQTEFLGCDWYRTDIYSWEGQIQLQQTVNDLPPDSAYCAVSPVVLAPEQFTAAERLEILTQALIDLQNNPATPDDYIGLVNLHIAMAYLGLGEDMAAAEQLQALFNQGRSSVFINLLTETYQADNGNILLTCQKIRQTISDNQGPYGNNQLEINWLSTFRVYMVEAACPLKLILKERLQNYLATSQTVSELLEKAAILPPEIFETAAVTFLYWPDSIDNTAFILQRENDQWQLYPFKFYFLSLSVVEGIFHDVDRDGQEDILLLVEYEDLPTNCSAADYGTYWLRRDDVGYRFDHPSISSCGSVPTLRELTVEDFVEEYHSTDPYWVELEGFPYDDNNILYYLRNLQKEVAANNLNVVTEIDTLINFLPPDDSTAGEIINQLRFMKGRLYEVNGFEPEAVETYRTLINQAPQSPWSWLAWARLAPAEK